VSEPRKHHYVPVFYQKHFVNPRGLLWVYDRSLKTCKELNPTSVCFAKDFYTLRRTDAPWDRRVETDCFSIVDGKCSSGLRAFLSQSATPEQLSDVLYFMAVQIHRTPSFAMTMKKMYVSSAEEMMRLMAVDVGRMQSALDRYKRDTGESTDVSAESMVKAVREKGLEVEATEAAFLRHIFSQAESTFKGISRLFPEVLIAPDNVGFITCDNPMTVVPPAGCPLVGLYILGTVSYFPLSRQVCLRLGQSGSRFDTRKISKEKVQVINQNIAASSERFVMGPDKAQLISTIKKSGSEEQDATPRHTVETLNPTDSGSYMKLTRHPTRYFYVKGLAP
jgi:hypothetical protein